MRGERTYATERGERDRLESANRALKRWVVARRKLDASLGDMDRRIYEAALARYEAELRRMHEWPGDVRVVQARVA